MTNELDRMSRFLMAPKPERSKLAAQNLEGFLSGRAPGGEPVTFAIHGADFYEAMTKDAGKKALRREAFGIARGGVKTAGAILDHPYESRHTPGALAKKITNDASTMHALDAGAKPTPPDTQTGRVQALLKGLADKSEKTAGSEAGSGFKRTKEAFGRLSQEEHNKLMTDSRAGLQRHLVKKQLLAKQDTWRGRRAARAIPRIQRDIQSFTDAIKTAESSLSEKAYERLYPLGTRESRQKAMELRREMREQEKSAAPFGIKATDAILPAVVALAGGVGGGVSASRTRRKILAELEARGLNPEDARAALMATNAEFEDDDAAPGLKDRLNRFKAQGTLEMAKHPLAAATIAAAAPALLALPIGVGLRKAFTAR